MEATASLPPYVSSKELVEQDPASDPLFRVSSVPSGSPDQQWRRRGGRRTSSLLARQRSFGREVGHAASETYLITRLSFKLLRYLGLPVDHETPFSCSLCHVSFAWISPRIQIYLWSP
ncbi:probable isoprenylcysteine alpha-carbonyl methylesterase ICMEL2 isoform X2 [Primulina huaijiensis]|uniref:probable isoprenylcysteine alpha-carbonyl methylesterase ICMEL2 isoform X2 n=1 Tax=Primulina huaijiensis TaxID=1492673 RepID=UPI003CC795DF